MSTEKPAGSLCVVHDGEDIMEVAERQETAKGSIRKAESKKQRVVRRIKNSFRFRERAAPS
jgi:hypothetical protein